MARDILIGLDLGSHTFRMLAVRPDLDAPDGLEILAAASVPASGIRRGTISSLDDASRAIAALRSEIERQIGAPVTEAFVGIGGPHIGSVVSRGLVVVSRADNRIGEDDVRRVLDAAGALSLGQNVEVLETMPREFIVDGQGGIKDVLGMQGRRLEAEAVVLTSATQHLKNLQQVLTKSDLNDHDLVVGALATARAVLTPRQRELGVALIDIGHGTTDIAVFEEGEILSVSVLPIGGAHVTNDIAIGMRRSIDAAERAKHEYGIANAGSVPKRDHFELQTIDPSQDGGSFSRRELAEIIDARLDEIFDLVGQELRRIDRWRLLPAGIVLAGGTANLPGIVDRARNIFRLPVQLGYPLIVSGPKDVVSDFSYATVLGLVARGVDENRSRKGRRVLGRRFAPAGLGGRITKLFRSILP